jgi:hypothetical protein
VPESIQPTGSQKADRLRAVHAVEPARHGERARQESACGSVTVRAEGRDPDGGGVAGIYGGVVGDVVDGSPIARVRIRAGTPLWWPDGAPAGALVADRTVPEDDLAPEGDGLRCLDRPLGWLEAGQPDPLDRHLSVCVRVNPTGTPSAPVTPL